MPRHQPQTLTHPAPSFIKKLESTTHHVWKKLFFRRPKPKRWFYLGWFGGVQIYQNGRRS